MISLESSRDGRKGLGHKREMDEIELEEGEACSYHDDDSTIDPDVALSYIDEKLQNVLGHFKKDFEGVVSAESLGAKFGIYGSFLPSHRRSPIWSHSKSPPRAQNVIIQSPNTLQAEGGHHNSVAPASISYSIKQGSASAGSASSHVYKPPPQNDRQNMRTNSVQSLEECTPKSVVRDQKTLKVRIKVGSDNLSVKKNAAIYSGLGLDCSPTSSPDDNLLKSKELSCNLSFDGFESPTRILQMMTSSPLFGGRFLSPLPVDLMSLDERPNEYQEIFTPSKTKPENSIRGPISSSGRDTKTGSDENSMGLLDKKDPQDKKDMKGSNINFDFQLKAIDDAVSCEELVSNALKLPLLSTVHSNTRDSPSTSLKEKVFSDASKRDPLEPVSVHASLSDKPNGKATSAVTVLQKKDEVRSSLVAKLEKVGGSQSETVDHTKISIGGSKYRKSTKTGLKDPLKQDTDKSTDCDNDAVLPRISSGDERKPKKNEVHDFSSRKIVTEITNDTSQVLNSRKFSDYEKSTCKVEMQKDSRKAKGQYADFFGEFNEQDSDIMDSPDVPSGEMLKTFEECDKTTLAYDSKSKGRTNSLETIKGATSWTKHRGYSNDASVPENVQPISEPPPINWVGCDKCQKWRIFPPGTKSDNLPDKWDCSMMTWLPNKNRCSTSEEETNNFHAPPSSVTSADVLGSALTINGKPTAKVRSTSKLTFQNSPKKLPSSMKKKQHSAKEKTSKEEKDSYMMNGLDFPQQTKSGDDIYLETGHDKKMDKHRTDCYSDGGHAKIPSTKTKRETDQEFSITSKKRKTWSIQTGDNDQAAAHNQGIEVLGVSSGYRLAAGRAGKGQVSNSEIFASQNPKGGMDKIHLDSLGKPKSSADVVPVVSSMHDSKSASKNKKRKSDNFKDPPNSTPSGRMVDDYDKSSRKRHRMCKSEGKDSSISKRNGKADKKGRSVSQHRLDCNESLQKDSIGANPVVTATSSSSKVSGSLRVQSKFQEVKGSPVESVSSSPLRKVNSDKLNSGSKVIVMNDNVQDAVKLARSSAADYEVNGNRSGALKKDVIPGSTLHGSSNHSMIDMQDKCKDGLQLNNGNGYIGNVDLENGYLSEAQALHRSVNEATKGEVHLDTYMSNSGKSWKGSPSLLKENNQSLKFNSDKGKVKMSENGNLLDHLSVHEEIEGDKKTKYDEKCGSNGNKNELNANKAEKSKEVSLWNSEEKEEFDNKRSSKTFEEHKTENLEPVSAKDKSRHLARCEGEKSEGLNVIQSSLGNKASTSACDARSDGHPRRPRMNKKSDIQNGTHIPSKHPVSNGNRIKNQEAPSPLRRDSSSLAASSAIKEATNLKHLADRLKSSGPAESTGMYFEAALKFLHGASLLESGKPENIKPADLAQSMQIYSSTAKLCQFCAHEFEKLKDMAAAALAYKCVEVAYLRVIYSSHNNAGRDRNELQTALQMVPPGESPSSSASDIDNLNNIANGDKTAQARSSGSPQFTGNLVIAAKNRPNFSRLLTFAQDVNSSMEASRKSRVAFAAINVSMGHVVSKDGITSIKRALDFNFHDVDGLLRLVRLAKEAITR